MPRSVGVVRPIILAFRAKDVGSNPKPSTHLLRCRFVGPATRAPYSGRVSNPHGFTVYQVTLGPATASRSPSSRRRTAVARAVDGTADRTPFSDRTGRRSRRTRTSARQAGEGRPSAAGTGITPGTRATRSVARSATGSRRCSRSSRPRTGTGSGWLAAGWGTAGRRSSAPPRSRPGGRRARTRC